MNEDRHVTLIRAARDIIADAMQGPYVRSVEECRAVWDSAVCGGDCLLEELQEWLTDHGLDKPALEVGSVWRAAEGDCPARRVERLIEDVSFDGVRTPFAVQYSSSATAKRPQRGRVPAGQAEVSWREWLDWAGEAE